MSRGANTEGTHISGLQAVTSAVRPLERAPPHAMSGVAPVDAFAHARLSPSTATGCLTATVVDGDAAACGMRTASGSPHEDGASFMVSQQALCSAAPPEPMFRARENAMHARELDAMHAAHAVAWTTVPQMRRDMFAFGGGEPTAASMLMAPEAAAAQAAAVPRPLSPAVAWPGVAPPSRPDPAVYGKFDSMMQPPAAHVPSPASLPAFMSDPGMDDDNGGFTAARMPSAPAFVGVLGPYGSWSGLGDGQSLRHV